MHIGGNECVPTFEIIIQSQLFAREKIDNSEKLLTFAENNQTTMHN
jgi:hypothetical protein